MTITVNASYSLNSVTTIAMQANFLRDTHWNLCFQEDSSPYTGFCWCVGLASRPTSRRSALSPSPGASERRRLDLVLLPLLSARPKTEPV